MDKSLNEIIQATRKGKTTLSQKELADKVEKKPQWISAIEKGDLTSLELLIQLHQALLPEESQTPDEELSFWFLKWLEESIAKAKKNGFLVGDTAESGLAAVRKLYDQSDKARRASVISGAVPTLEHFPHA